MSGVGGSLAYIQGATEAFDREANVLNSSCDILGWILHARCTPFIFSATRRYARDDLIPFKSDVLCASKKAAKIESVNPDAMNISIIHYSGIITRVGALASCIRLFDLRAYAKNNSRG